MITPNIPEAEILANLKIKSIDDMVYAGYKLLKLGAKNIYFNGNIKLINKLDENKIKNLSENKLNNSKIESEVQKEVISLCSSFPIYDN